MDGMATKGGIDLMELTIDRFLNFVYHAFTEPLSTEDKAKFDMQLNMPPAGGVSAETLKNTPWSAEAEEQALAAFAAMHSSTVEPAL